MKPKCRSAEYFRIYRAKNRERILAQEKALRANRTPEQIARDCERKRMYRERHDPNYGIGRGHGRHATTIAHMTKDEKKAHKYAQKMQWRENNRAWCNEYHRERQRKMYIPHPRVILTDEEKKARRRRREWLYRQNNYQKCLARERA